MLTIKKVDITEVPRIRDGRGTKNLVLLQEFINGGYEAALVSDNSNPDRNTSAMWNSIYASIRRFGYENMIKAVVRDKKVYLVRLHDEEKDA